MCKNGEFAFSFFSVTESVEHNVMQSVVFRFINPPIIGTDTSPDRQNRENRDVEVSKKVENIAKKLFLQKKNFFSWDAFGSRYFVSRIVFGCGGAGNARTSSIS